MDKCVLDALIYSLRMKTRCDCLQLGFLSLLAYARRHGISTLEDLMKATGCGTGCGSCRPFLEELLKTGRLKVGDQLLDLPGAGRAIRDEGEQ